jgi:hypothetical protein
MSILLDNIFKSSGPIRRGRYDFPNGRTIRLESTAPREDILRKSSISDRIARSGTKANALVALCLP